MQNLKAIFWDNDGLLVDTESIFFQATKDVFATEGIELSREWYMRENLGKGRSSLDLPREKGFSEEVVRELGRQRDDRYAELLMERVPIVDGIPEVLTALQGRFLMGVATSSPRRHFDIIMEKTGLRRFFDFTITADDVKKVKPDPELYLKAWTRSGYPKEQCLAIEDSLRGVQAAKTAGLACFAVPDGLTKGHDFSIADKVLGSIRELPSLILKGTQELS